MGIEVQIKMMGACAVGCTAFGVLYGINFLPNRKKFKRYLLGHWNYKSKRKFFGKLLVYAFCLGIPYLVLNACNLIKNSPIIKFTASCLSIELICFCLAFLVPFVSDKLNLIKYCDGSYQTYQD